jgi:putative nucleotidyltransferase with HDIG domain
MMPKTTKPPIAHEQLLDLVPIAPLWQIEWPTIWSLWPELAALDTCPQDPIHHAEGDAGTHTRMVVEALVCDPHWQQLPREEQSMLFWAAILHDIGKPATTRQEENSRISSRGHSRIGASIARHLLWYARSPFTWREALCGIILNHQLPFWLIERPDPKRLAIEVSWQCRPDLLCLHARADALGRICKDQQAILEHIDLAEVAFQEAECLNAPFTFANAESRVAFFDLPDRDPNYAAYEDFSCTVTVMSGLPGAGKDTWVCQNKSNYPVVSLDMLREELRISATDNQGRVIQAAYERAKEYLRNGQDFVWNATNVTRQNRSKIIQLLRDYGAKIQIVYLEVAPDRLYHQNRQRPDQVPVAAIDHLSKKMEPPQLWEAHSVSFVVK